MLSLSEVKDHLRVEVDDDDTLIGNLLTAAYSFVEKYCDSIILDTEKVDYLDCFQSEIMLKHSPVQSITSIAYNDEDSASQSQTDYYLDTREQRAVLKPKYGETWPATDNTYENVVITYQSGYASTPEQVNQAVLMLIGSLYEQRENHIIGVSIDTIPLSAEYLLEPYRFVTI